MVIQRNPILRKEGWKEGRKEGRKDGRKKKWKDGTEGEGKRKGR